MTAYPVPAHLFFNLLWLYFYTRKDGRGWLLLPWIGIIAIGLHQPVVHVLFVAPFIIRAFSAGNKRTLFYWLAVYGAGCWLWWQWRAFIIIGRIDHPKTFGALAWPSIDHCATEIMCISLFFVWQSLALSLLFVLGALLPEKGFAAAARPATRPLDHFKTDLILGVFLSFGFYFFFPPDQGHGWGYRYVHAVLGNVVLVALAGWDYLQDKAGLARARQWLIACVLFACIFQLPLRCWQAEAFTRPFARASRDLQSSSKKYVVIDCGTIWYGCDLVRNDPRFQPGLRLLFAANLTDEMMRQLKRRDDTWFVSTAELTAQGLHPTPPPDDNREPNK
jgi:hypothetical protein